MRKIKIPSKILDAVKKWERFLALFGGRGGAKSESIARVLLFEGSKNKHRILCGREYQNSIADSVHSLLSDTIEAEKIPGYKVTEKYIKHNNGTEFLFKGLKKESVGSIKSLNKITLAWIEEAQFVSRRSLEILTPTIREPNSKIVYTFNVESEEDPIYADYVLPNRPDTIVQKVNYYDNPWFGEPLKSEMEYDKKYNYEKYLHTWEGEPVQHSEDQIFFGKWKVDEFETPEDTQFFHGIDWGFSVDALAGIRSFIKDDTLYIDREAYKVGVEITETAQFLLNHIPTIATWLSKADNARPEMISHLRHKNGFNIRPAKKGKGSVEDGIEKIKGFKKVVINPNCVHTIDEFRNYKYKRNRLTDEITPVPEDKHNHIIDALRYSLEDYGRTVKITRY